MIAKICTRIFYLFLSAVQVLNLEIYIFIVVFSIVYLIYIPAEKQICVSHPLHIY